MSGHFFYLSQTKNFLFKFVLQYRLAHHFSCSGSLSAAINVGKVVVLLGKISEGEVL